MTLRAIVFDVDGTLAETEELHRCAFNETFAAHGLDWRWDQDRYRALLQVTGGKERIAHDLAERGIAADDHDIPTLHRARTSRYTELMARGEIALRMGIADMIRTGHEAGLRLGIATTTSRPNIDALIRAPLGGEAGDPFPDDCTIVGDFTHVASVRALERLLEART